MIPNPYRFVPEGVGHHVPTCSCLNFISPTLSALLGNFEEKFFSSKREHFIFFNLRHKPKGPLNLRSEQGARNDTLNLTG